MKRVVSIGLLVFLFFHTGGFYVYFFIRMMEIRKEMRMELSHLPSSQLDSITVPKSDLQEEWLEEMEMRWKGKMYDIARIEDVGTSVIIYCLHDAEEDSLVLMLHSIIKRASGDKKPVPFQILQFNFLCFLPVECDWDLHQIEPDVLNIPYSQHYSSFTPRTDTPPPWA